MYTTDAFDTWKCCASASNKNTTTKKSNASSTQPRIPEPTANFQPFVSRSIFVSVPVTNAMFQFAVSAAVSYMGSKCNYQFSGKILEWISYYYSHLSLKMSGFSWEKAARKFTASTTPIGNPLDPADESKQNVRQGGRATF